MNSALSHPLPRLAIIGALSAWITLIGKRQMQVWIAPYTRSWADELAYGLTFFTAFLVLSVLSRRVSIHISRSAKGGGAPGVLPTLARLSILIIAFAAPWLWVHGFPKMPQRLWRSSFASNRPAEAGYLPADRTSLHRLIEQHP